MEMRRAAVLILVIFLCLWAVACQKPVSDSPARPKLRIGYLPIAAELPLFVAVERGYLREAGLDYVLTQFASSNELVNAATADRIDVLAGAATNVVWDAGSVSNKKHLLFVLNPYSNNPGSVTDYLLVRAGSTINSVSQLRGKKVASFPGSVKVLVHLGLEKMNLPRSAYDTIEMLPSDWQPSLQAGAIDAVVALEPNATQIMKDRAGRPLVSGFYATIMKDLPLSGHWIAADYYNRTDKRQINALLAAYTRAIHFCRDNEREAKEYLKKYANVREDILDKVGLNPWRTRKELNGRSIQSYADLLKANNALAETTETSRYLLPN